jgi:hypothetical protein
LRVVCTIRESSAPDEAGPAASFAKWEDEIPEASLVAGVVLVVEEVAIVVVVVMALPR